METPKRVTIKDVAQKAGVSCGTVHRALYGKKGVSEEVRAKVVRLAAECGYTPNTAAAALKRRTMRVLVAFPGTLAQNKYYYSNVWQGFHDCIAEIGNYNFEVVELPYYNSVSGNSMAEELSAALARYPGQVDGVLAAGPFQAGGRRMLQQLIRQGVPVSVATDQVEGAIISVSADYEATGRLVAELLSHQLQPQDHVLVCAGGAEVLSHAGVSQGFSSYLAQAMPQVHCVYVHSAGGEQEPASGLRMRELLETDPAITAGFSVTARGSVLLVQAAQQAGRLGQLALVGSDLFDENAEALRTGRLQNIVCKGPYEQAYQASKALFEYLLRGTQPALPTQFVQSNIVFRSNLEMYL